MIKDELLGVLVDVTRDLGVDLSLSQRRRIPLARSRLLKARCRKRKLDNLIGAAARGARFVRPLINAVADYGDEVLGVSPRHPQDQKGHGPCGGRFLACGQLGNNVFGTSDNPVDGCRPLFFGQVVPDHSHGQSGLGPLAASRFYFEAMEGCLHESYARAWQVA